MSKLSDRISTYQSITDYKLLPRVPIIIIINGRGFSKVTQLLDKPHCVKFTEAIMSTMLCLCTEIEGAIFAYQHNDEIVIVAHNDQNIETNVWFNGSIQKICSVTSAIATMHFNECALRLQLNMTGNPIFTSQVFVVPTIGEVNNTLIFKQQQNFHTSIQSACLYNLLETYNKDEIKNMLNGLSIDEKINLLDQEAHIKFNNYSSAFRRGTACYKAPKIVNGIMKNKWHFNNDLPIFTKDTSFLSNLLKNGMDIFRGEP